MESMNWKTRSLLLLTAFLLSVLTAAAANAQNEKLLVADASSSGTYHSMLKEISSVCSTPDSGLIIERVDLKGGATENLQALMNNEASAAFMHSDVIYAMAQSDAKYQSLFTLVALYPEEIHIIAKRNSGVKTGGTLGFGAKATEFNSLGDLKGYKLGAAGGGFLTAKILQGTGEGGFEVVQFDHGPDLLPALNDGRVQAIVFVGGAPLKNVRDLSASDYKLLPIPEAMRAKLGGVYKPAVVTYPNLRASGIQTMSADAIILTRKYSTPKMRAPQQKFRDCFYAKLDELKETPKLHPKWQAIDPANHGKWQWYDLPVAQGPVVVPVEAPPAKPARQGKKLRQ